MVDGLFTQTIHIVANQPRNAEPVEANFNQLFSNTSLLGDSVDQLASQVSGGKLSATNITEYVPGRGVAVDNVAMMDGKARLISIVAQISGSNAGTPIFTTQSAHGLTTGQAIKFAAAPGSILDGGFSGNVIYFARQLSSTTLTAHPTVADASANTNAVAVTTASTGTRFIVARPTGLQEGQVYTDGEGTGIHVVLKGQIVDIPTDIYSLLTRFSGTKTPKYLSPTTFSIDRIAERDSGNNIAIVKSSSTTVDISTIGLNGIAQSGNLNGTVSVTSGSASVSFSASQTTGTPALVPNDILTTAGGQARKIVSVSGTSAVVESPFNTTESAVTFKRGGRVSFSTTNTTGVTGTAHYYLYAISDGTTPGLILSTRNVAAGDTLVDLPNGYIYSKILPWWETLYSQVTAAGVYSGVSIKKIAGAGWPYRAEIWLDCAVSYYSAGSVTNGDAMVLNNGTQTVDTTIDASAFIPKISRLAFISALATGRPSAYVLRETGTIPYTYQIGDFNGGNSNPNRPLPVSANQQFDYKGFNTAGPLTVDIAGCVITELF